MDSPKNTSFRDFTSLIEGFGFELARMNGSHHIYTYPKIDELINLQNVKGNAKPYQIKQFLKLVERYKLTLDES